MMPELSNEPDTGPSRTTWQAPFPAPSPLYFCLHVAEFPAQALLRLRPELRSQSVAVLDGTPPLDQVCSCNAKARRSGVYRGATRSELESFTGLTLLRRSQPEEASARLALLEVAGSFTPRVEPLALPAPHSSQAHLLALDMTGSERILGPPIAAAGKLLRAIHGFGFSARVGISANLHAAACAVRQAAQAITLLPPGGEAAVLATLPLTALPLTAAEADAFALWGLRTLGELAAIAEAELVSRLGPGATRLRNLALGRHPHLFVPAEAALLLEEMVEFDSPVETLESLLFVLGPMLAQLILRAGQRARALGSLTVDFQLEGGGVHQRTVKPALPSADRTLLLKLLQLDLQAHPPPAGVLTVHLQAEPGPRPQVQSGLFSPQLPEPMQLDVTLARIAALVGENRVGRAVLDDTHRPEAFHMERFTLAQAATSRNAAPPPFSTSPKRRSEALPLRTHSSTGHSFGIGIAVRRLRPPIVLNPETAQQRPAAFVYRGARYCVRRCFGPWRRSGHWWSQEVWSREEWDIEAESSSGRLLCLIARDLLMEQWRLELLYD